MDIAWAHYDLQESEATVEDLIGMFVEKLKTKYTDCEDVSKSDVQLSQVRYQFGT